MIKYRTKFRLTNPVIDFEAARDYLLEDDMTRYLQYDNRISETTINKIDKIEFILKSEQKGKIEITANDELSERELLSITDWVKGQLSDGLGEGFIQQPFACYESKDAIVYDNNQLEQGFIIADFDFNNDDYIFQEV